MILTSAQAIRAVAKRGEGLKLSLIRSESKPRIACVRPVSAEVARQAGFAVEYGRETPAGRALAGELRSRLEGAERVLPRRARANPHWASALRRYGPEVT